MPLLTAFCKAFNLLDANSEADPTISPKFQEFAIKWDTFLDQEPMELHNIVKEIRKVSRWKYNSDDLKEGGQGKSDRCQPRSAIRRPLPSECPGR